jgi:hypothetical protein
MKRISLLVMITLVSVLTARALPISWSSPGTTPDFGQQYNSAWSSGYCAPTAAADGIYWLGQYNTNLLQGNPVGNDSGASAIISQLGGFMGTDPTNGTSASGIVKGLNTYLGDYGGSQTYSVSLTYADEIGGGTNLLEDMEIDLMGGQVVLPLIIWNGTDIGHVVDMTGWDTNDITIKDPDAYPYSIYWSDTSLAANISGYPTSPIDGIGISYVSDGYNEAGTIEGFVGISDNSTESSVPEPGTFILVGLGMTFLSRRVRWAKG